LIEKTLNKIRKLYSEKKYAKASLLCKRAIKKYPKNKEFNYFFGLIFYAQKSFTNSIIQFDIFLNDNPNQIDGLIAKIHSLRALKKHKEAIKILMKIDQIDTRKSEIYLLIAESYFFLKDNEQGKKFLKKTLDLVSTKESLNKIYNILINFKEYTEAIRIIKNSEFSRKDPDFLCKIAKSLIAKKKFSEAKEYLKRAIKIDSKNPEYFNELGVIYSILGENNLAEKEFCNCIDLDSSNGSSHHQLSLLNFKISNFQLKSLEEKYQNETTFNLNKIYLGLALSNFNEKKKEYNKSFELLNECNSQYKRNYIDKSEWSFNHEKNTFKNVQLLYAENYKLLDLKPTHIKPVFILGLPRSGTTLVEQIISNSVEIFAGGELTYFHDEFESTFNGLLNENFTPSKIDSSDLERIQLNYLKKVESDKKIFTDKLPVNFMYMGFIQSIFPNSKIILCRRNKLDNLLSLFKTFFTASHFNYSYDLISLRAYYNLYTKLVTFWNDMKVNYYSLNYEELVEDPENQVRNLCNYIGIKFQDNLLNFHKNKRPVHTASFHQVRKPIFKSSINNWRNYKDHLELLI